MVHGRCRSPHDTITAANVVVTIVVILLLIEGLHQVFHYANEKFDQRLGYNPHQPAIKLAWNGDVETVLMGGLAENSGLCLAFPNVTRELLVSGQLECRQNGQLVGRRVCLLALVNNKGIWDPSFQAQVRPGRKVLFFRISLADLPLTWECRLVVSAGRPLADNVLDLRTTTDYVFELER